MNGCRRWGGERGGHASRRSGRGVRLPQQRGIEPGLGRLPQGPRTSPKALACALSSAPEALASTRSTLSCSGHGWRGKVSHGEEGHAEDAESRDDGKRRTRKWHRKRGCRSTARQAAAVVH